MCAASSLAGIAPTVNDHIEPWAAGTACVASDRHTRDGEECQDAVAASAAPRAFVAVFDGRGSSPHSQHGSRGAAAAMPRIAEALEHLLRQVLDKPGCSSGTWRAVGELVLRLLQEEQRRVSDERSLSVTEVEHTVSLAFVGEHSIGVVQLGDSAVFIARANGSLQMAAPRHQGELAGETVFLNDRESSIAVADYLLLPAADAVAVLAFSDGVAAGWLDETSGAAAPGLTSVIERLRAGAWGEADILRHLHQPVWRRLQDDDRSVAYVARVTRSEDDGVAQRQPRSDQTA